jgi:CubicO group peptidase (beta-lactamase class C family)
MNKMQPIWIAFLILSPLPSFAQTLPSVDPQSVGIAADHMAKLSEFMDSLVKKKQIAGGVTMMVRHGKVAHLKAIGFADREQQVPMNTDSIFRIASMTKPVTAVAVMLLVERGKIRLDDPLHEYLPEFENPKVVVAVDPLRTVPAKKGPITIRHLLCHTSGLGYPFSKKIGPMFKEHKIPTGCLTSKLTLCMMTGRLSKLPLIFEPGEKWEYSMSLDVLGRVVEVASERSFPDFCRDEIFQPLGMKDTYFRIPDAKLKRLVVAYAV